MSDLFMRIHRTTAFPSSNNAGNTVSEAGRAPTDTSTHFSSLKNRGIHIERENGEREKKKSERERVSRTGKGRTV